MKITDLVSTNSGGGSTGYEFAPGDVKITTKNFESGFTNLNYETYLVRKENSNINQNLNGPSFDLYGISNDNLTIDSGLGDYSEVYKINETDYVVIFTDFFQIGLKEDLNVIIKYISDGIVTDSKVMNFTFPVLIENYNFRSVCNYVDKLYFFKDYNESQGKDYSTAIYKLTFDSVNKTLSTISTISTVNRRILKAFYDKTTSRYITVENNMESDPTVTSSEYQKAGIFKDTDFENINVLTNSTAFFNIDDGEFYEGNLKTTLGSLPTLEALNNISTLIEVLFYSNEDNKIFIYDRTNKNYTLVKDKGEVTENIIYNVIDLLSILETSVSQDPFTILEFKNDIIVSYSSFNSLSQNCKSFSVYNKIDESNKRIHLENVEIFNKHGYLIIDNVYDYVSNNFETAILSHYTDEINSVIKRKVTTFNNITHYDVNDKTVNQFIQISRSPERTGYNQLVNNENKLYVINNIGAIEEPNGKLSRIDYSQFNFPFVYIQQVLNAPVGLFYLLKI